MRGFTLLELLIIVLIIGVLAGLAQPVLTRSVTHVFLEGATSEVATALRYARATAINTGRSTRVVFDAANETVEVSQVVHANMTDLLDTGQSELDEVDVDDPSVWSYIVMDHPMMAGEPYSLDFGATEEYGGLDIVSAVFGAGEAVDFDSSGFASEDGVVTIDFAGVQSGIKVYSDTGTILVSN